MDKISQPVRILAIVIVLAGAAGMLGMRMLGPSVVEETSVAPVVAHTTAKPKAAKPKAAKPKAAKPVKAAPAKKVKTAPAKAAAAVPALNAPKPAAKAAAKPAVPPTGFPVAIDAALRKHAVLVVSLVVPGSRVDALAAAEAQAGAALAGAGYLALNVLDEDVARALLTKLDDVDIPRVLVLKRSGEVALALALVDFATVAQAAANASQ